MHTAITDEFKGDHFQPTNINFGLLPAAVVEPILQSDKGPYRKPDKKEKKVMQIQKAKEALLEWLNDHK